LHALPFKRIFLGIVAYLSYPAAMAASPSACNLPIYRLCIESPTLDLSAECAKNGGVLGYACSTEQRIGSCAKRQGEHSVYLRYYQGVNFDPAKNCAENGGVYTPD